MLHFTLPVANSTTDGTPIPTAAVSLPRAVPTAPAISSMSARASPASVGTTRRGPSLPLRSVAIASLVPPTSTPITSLLMTAAPPMRRARSPHPAAEPHHALHATGVVEQDDVGRAPGPKARVEPERRRGRLAGGCDRLTERGFRHRRPVAKRGIESQRAARQAAFCRSARRRRRCARSRRPPGCSGPEALPPRASRR